MARTRYYTKRLTLAMPEVDVNWPSISSSWDTELSAASPWRVQEASALPLTAVGGKRPVVPFACGELLGALYVSLVLKGKLKSGT